MREGKEGKGKGRPTSEAWVERKEKERQYCTIITPCICKLAFEVVLYVCDVCTASEHPHRTAPRIDR